MIFEHQEDVITLKKVGLNVVALVGVTLLLIVAAALVG